MVIKPGIYRHYKGNFYEVFGVERHTETGEQLVSYRTLYAENEKGIQFGKRYARPLGMFKDEVLVDETPTQRFTYVCPTPWV